MVSEFSSFANHIAPPSEFEREIQAAITARVDDIMDEYVLFGDRQCADAEERRERDDIIAQWRTGELRMPYMTGVLNAAEGAGVAPRPVVNLSVDKLPKIITGNDVRAVFRPALLPEGM